MEMSQIVLPSTVEELNYMQSAQYIKSDTADKGFENILVAGGYKREVSLPDGVNWNVYDYDTYLNFEENNASIVGNGFKVDDCIVPGDSELRQRTESFSDSFSSGMEDKTLAYQSLGVKTFSTVCVDSGSTCISSEHSYVSPSPPVYRGLDEEETYQNLSSYFKQTSDVHNNDSLNSLSPVSSPADASNLEYSVLNNFSTISHCSSSQDSFSEISVGSKRPAESPDPDTFLPSKRSSSTGDYSDVRKKNNLSSKNCRKTRKEKQKEMEARVTDLEREREQLNSTIEMLEKAIKAHHVHLCSILGSRQQAVA